MSAITFYIQGRRDGGVRTGIEIDGRTVFTRFEGGANDRDPSLLWYVDVRCEGRRLPGDPAGARQWLLDHEEPIVGLLRSLADDLPAGFDPDDWPIQRSRKLAGGTQVTVACSAVRRPEARQIAEVLRDVADQWRRRIENLAQLPAA